MTTNPYETNKLSERYTLSLPKVLLERIKAFSEYDPETGKYKPPLSQTMRCMLEEGCDRRERGNGK